MSYLLLVLGLERGWAIDGMLFLPMATYRRWPTWPNVVILMPNDCQGGSKFGRSRVVTDCNAQHVFVLVTLAARNLEEGILASLTSWAVQHQLFHFVCCLNDGSCWARRRSRIQRYQIGHHRLRGGSATSSLAALLMPPAKRDPISQSMSPDWEPAA